MRRASCLGVFSSLRCKLIGLCEQSLMKSHLDSECKDDC